MKSNPLKLLFWRSSLFLGLILASSGANAASEKPGAGAFGCSAELAGTATANEEDALQMLLRDPRLKDQILARRRYKGDVLFLIPEYRPVLRRMLDTIDDLEARAKYAGARNILHVPNYYVNHPVRTALLRTRAYRLLVKPRYWAVMELANDLTDLVDATLSLERQLEGHEYHFGGDRRWLIKENRRDARELPVLFVPSFYEITIPEMNRVWGQGILPMGLVTEMSRADGENMSAVMFMRHDMQHAQLFTTALFRLAGMEYLFSVPKDHSYGLGAHGEQKLAEVLRKHSKRLERFNERMNLIGDAKFRKAVQWTFFAVDHEEGLYLTGRKSDLERLRAEAYVGLTSIRGLIQDPKSGYSFADKDFWIGVHRWVQDAWIQAGEGL